VRALVQRVSQASVTIEGQPVASIKQGLVVLLGAGRGDTEADTNYLADKIANLRIFSDEADKFNLSALDTGGEVLVVSQFTLYGDTRKGRRICWSRFTTAARSLSSSTAKNAISRGEASFNSCIGMLLQAKRSNLIVPLSYKEHAEIASPSRLVGTDGLAKTLIISRQRSAFSSPYPTRLPRRPD